MNKSKISYSQKLEQKGKESMDVFACQFICKRVISHLNTIWHLFREQRGASSAVASIALIHTHKWEIGGGGCHTVVLKVIKRNYFVRDEINNYVRRI